MSTRPKRQISDLAAFGGPPLFETPLHVGRPNLGDRSRLHARIDEALDRRVLSNGGPLAEEFERALQPVTRAPYVRVVANATIGLQVLARALDLDGEVVMPAFTFVGSAHAFEWIGLRPVFADIDEETMLLDPAAVEEVITPRSSAFLGVHLYGRVCDVDGLSAVARRHGIPLLLDAAQALGSQARGRPVGTFGQAEVLSFHATKMVNAFEGGAITTADERLADVIDPVRNFGFVDWDEAASLGTNAKMSEASAAMGLTSLEHLDRLLAIYRRNAHRYAQAVADIPGVGATGVAGIDESNAQHVVLRVDAQAAGISRDRLVELLWAEGVRVRRYFYPGAHRLAPYRERSRQPSLPVTDRVASEVICLPTGEGVGDAAIDAVGDTIRFILSQAPALATG